MHGLVNQDVQGLITKEHGEAKWNEIKAKTGFEDGIFVSMQKYDDSVTDDLVGEASEILNVKTGWMESHGLRVDEGFRQAIQCNEPEYRT